MNGNNGQSGNGAGTRGAGGTGTAIATESKVNVNPVERVSSVALGSLLLLRGLRRPPLALAGSALIYRGLSGHSYLYKALGVKTTGGAYMEAGAPPDALEVKRYITIKKSPEETYRSWLEPRILSASMGHFAEVSEAPEGRMHWSIKGPLGRSTEWETRVVEDRPGEYVRWESLPGAGLPNEGWVRFRPAPRDWGTEMFLHFRFDPPGGRLGRKAANMLKSTPSLLLGKALRRFKSLVEAGEIPTIERQPAGRKGGRD